MPSPFPCSSVIRECSWKKSEIEKKTLNIVSVLISAADFNLFNCVFFRLTLASWQFTIIYNAVTIPWENFSLVPLILSQIVKTKVNSLAAIAFPGFFSCPTNSICWIVFGLASNSFFLLRSIAINL